jgi:predicted nucleic acid-binding protein
MNILFDTNIIAEYFEHRAQYGFVRPILQAVRDGQHKGFITQGTVYTLTYLAERALKRSGIHEPELTERLRDFMLSIMQLFEPVGISKLEFIKAILNRDFKDLEDSMQLQTAISHNCDVLLTININDFKKSTDDGVELLTPQDFVELYMKP